MPGERERERGRERRNTKYLVFTKVFQLLLTTYSIFSRKSTVHQFKLEILGDIYIEYYPPEMWKSLFPLLWLGDTLQWSATVGNGTMAVPSGTTGTVYMFVSQFIFSNRLTPL